MERADRVTNDQSRVPLAIAIAAMAVGIALRVLEFSRDRPLWLDEAMLALNIGARSFTDLARPLDYDQSAPLLYLWIERALVLAGGVDERTLRLLPLLAGAALIPAVWLVGRRMIGESGAAVATVFVATSLTLVTFSAEAKQYGVDPLFTLMAAGLAARVAAAPEDERRWRHLLAGGVVALVASQPAVFTLGGAALALRSHERVRGATAGRRWLAASALAWAATFAMLYFSLYRTTAESGYMQRFWEGTFLDPRAPDLWLRLRMFAHAVFVAPLPAAKTIGPSVAPAIGWALGVSLLWRRNRVSALLIGAPLVLATGASVLGLYPVMDRLYLFAAPLVLLGLSALAARFVEAAPESRRQGGLVVTGIAIASFGAGTHIERVRAPVFYGVGKQIVADVDSMSRGDPVYVAARSFPLWVFYTTDWERPDAARLAWAAGIAGAGSPAHNNAPSRGRRVELSEARQLARHHRGRTEIVGLPTGRQYLTSTRTLDPELPPAEYALPPVPDPGWSAVEVDRMAEVARPRVWVFGSHMFALDGAEAGLVTELQRRGVRLLMERRQGGTVAYHVEFPRVDPTIQPD